GSVSHSQACDSLYYGQAEDYSVRCYNSHLKPEADFTYSIDDPCARVVEFYDFSSWLPVSWFWDFGDGSTGSGETVIHDYLYAGNYSVQLIAVNSYGSDTTVINFFIDSVYASFNVPNTVFAGQNTAFYNYSSGANSYSWNFGDGKTSSSVNPTHIYNNTGTVTVTLIAANTLTGCSDTIIKQIIVLPPGYISELPGKSNTVRIDPNPVTGSGEIVIYDDKIRDWQLIFSDIYGKDVIRAEMLNTNKFTFNSQELSAGLYFYKVIHKDALIGIGKIIIE
ncbi:MAG: PKD domain-containing protein, partial [Bacteroidetes bacterium]|nr:PKD domain-containing protein [Bacteroidota bacterium]